MQAPLRATSLISLLWIACICSVPFFTFRITPFSYPFALPEIILAILFCVTILQNRRFFSSDSSRVLLHKNAALLLWGALFGASILASTCAQSTWIPGLGVLKSWFIAPYIFCIITILFMQKVRDPLSVFSHGIFMMLTVLCITILTEITVFPNEAWTYDHRLRSFFGAPNYLALFCTPLLPLGIWVAHTAQSRWKRYCAYGMSGTLFLFIILSRSLDSLFAIGIISLLAVVFLWSNSVIRTIALYSIAILVCIVALQWHTPRIQDFFHIPTHSSLASRIVIWQVAGAIIANNPFFGVGPNLFQDTYLSYQQFYPPYPEWAVPHPHNFFLATWIFSGISGLLCMIAICVVLSRYCINALSQPMPPACKTFLHALILAMLIVCAQGVFDTPYWKYDLAWEFWLFVSGIAFVVHANHHKTLLSEK